MCRYYDSFRDFRQNKGGILKESVDYIRRLIHYRLSQNEDRQRQLELPNRRLLLRIQQLDLQVKTHGFPLPPGPPGGDLMSITTVVDCGSNGWTDLLSAPLTPSIPPYMKTEPQDDNAFRKVISF